VSVTVHIVTKHFPPTHGGLEAWTRTLAKILAEKGHKPVIYLREPANAATVRLAEEVGASLEPLAPTTDFLAAPLLGGNAGELIVKKERFRFDALTIRRRVCAWMRQRKGKHVLLSNFALFEGFLANSVAAEVGLPHVAVLAGSDFSRGIRNPQDLVTLERVVLGARLVVTKSEEQERFLREVIGVTRVRTIETSVEDAVTAQRTFKFAGDVPIFSDCGFTHKKGTQVLLRAFQQLRAQGYPVSLTICGDLDTAQDSFWRPLLESTRTEHCNHFQYLGYLSQGEVIRNLQRCAIYASATVGEGCSKARATALCVGAPMVTTRCGEWRIDKDFDGVFLAEVGDLEGFEAQLRLACEQTIQGKMREPDAASYQERFSRARECSAWLSVFASLDV
jgi:glycosyltransferase involved in cell wall biosynthesis